MIPLPHGAKFFSLPGYRPLGWNHDLGEVVYLSDPAEDISAVSAFLPPGYIRLHLPGAYYKTGATALPLWSYTALAWKGGKFWVPAVKVDDDSHWNPSQFDDRGIDKRIMKKKQRLPGNRLVEHLAVCAHDYHCFAAKNYFSERWECPLPVSPQCNADCIGCLSLQTEHEVCSSMERIRFVPTPQEIAAIALDHQAHAPEPMFSFGQGCEGDPLLQADIIEEAIRIIKSERPDATINVNTNASLPAEVKKLADAGLDSIRVSMNSAKQLHYELYHRPKTYSFDDVLESIRTAYDAGLFVNLNLLVFPGISDQEDEIKALTKIIRKCGVHRIQMKNLCIDPRMYLDRIGYPPIPGIGIRAMMDVLQKEAPDLQFGYFNLPKDKFFSERPTQ